MKITYTDNYGKERTMEVPDDTTQEVLAFLDESETYGKQQNRRDRYRLQQFDMTEEELFHKSICKPLLPLEKILCDQEYPGEIKRVLDFVKVNCTEKQKRRYYLHTLYNIPISTVAYWESCTEQAITESIRTVLLKIKFSTSLV